MPTQQEFLLRVWCPAKRNCISAQVARRYYIESSTTKGKGSDPSECDFNDGNTYKIVRLKFGSKLKINYHSLRFIIGGGGGQSFIQWMDVNFVNDDEWKQPLLIKSLCNKKRSQRVHCSTWHSVHPSIHPSRGSLWTEGAIAYRSALEILWRYICTYTFND